MSVDLLSIGTRKGSEVRFLEQIALRFGKEKDTKSLERCGTSKLYKFSDNESLESSATDAALDALKKANIFRTPREPTRLDGIYSSVATISTNYRVPGLARIVGHNIELANMPMISLSMGCAGGVHALQAAYNQSVLDSMLGHHTNYLVIAGDHTEKVLDKQSWNTSGIFSDGVAALVISNYIPGSHSIRRIESTNLEGDIDSMKITTEDKYFRMNGSNVLDFAVKKAFPRVLSLLGLDNLPENCYFIPHQASGVVLNAMQRRYNIPSDQFYNAGIKTVGNMPGSSIFFGLEDTLNRNLARKRDIIIGGFGAELAVGAVYLERNYESGIRGRK